MAARLYNSCKVGDYKEFNKCLHLSNASYRQKMLDFVDPRYQMNPFLLACRGGHCGMIETLLHHNPDYIKSLDLSKSNGLHHCLHGMTKLKDGWLDKRHFYYYRLIGMLVEAGIDINQQDHRGRTALHLVAFQPYFYLSVQKLVNLGAKTNIKSNLKDTVQASKYWPEILNEEFDPIQAEIKVLIDNLDYLNKKKKEKENKENMKTTKNYKIKNKGNNKKQIPTSTDLK